MMIECDMKLTFRNNMVKPIDDFSAFLSYLIIALKQYRLYHSFTILLRSSAEKLAKSGYFSLFNSKIEWNIRENL